MELTNKVFERAAAGKDPKRVRNELWVEYLASRHDIMGENKEFTADVDQSLKGNCMELGDTTSMTLTADDMADMGMPAGEFISIKELMLMMSS